MGQNQFKIKRQYWEDNGAHGNKDKGCQNIYIFFFYGVIHALYIFLVIHITLTNDTSFK
jgi:hypothetical protein